MKHGFSMPKLGLTMTEGMVAEWSMQPGEQFDKGQCLFVVETDKAANDIEADEPGTLLEIVHAKGTTVPVGEIIGYWDDGRGDAAAQATAEPQARPDPDDSRPPSVRVLATPLARRIAESRGIDLAMLLGSGPRGRITLDDLGSVPVPPPPAVGTVAAAGTGPATEPVPASATHLSMARRLTAAKSEVPHFYLAREADVGRLVALRAELNAGTSTRYTFTHFIIAAVGRALRDEPLANRVWADGSLLQFSQSDVGVAVSTGQGLYVPVLRDAGRLPLGRIAQELEALAGGARAARLSEGQMSGGAITVSNAGMLDVTYMTPIINPGQAMILGVGSVRPVFRPDAQGVPVLHREMGLVLACDHRVLDGAAGLRMLGRIVHYLEHPLQLLLDA